MQAVPLQKNGKILTPKDSGGTNGKQPVREILTPKDSGGTNGKQPVRTLATATWPAGSLPETACI
jgi:hypothetical protein